MHLLFLSFNIKIGGSLNMTQPCANISKFIGCMELILFCLLGALAPFAIQFAFIVAATNIEMGLKLLSEYNAIS
jgi:hypothetical protein